MSYQRPTKIFKHVHLHYHYDINDKNSLEPFQKISSKSTLTPQPSQVYPQKSSWKNHINPQITKLYEEISINQSFHDTYTPKASRMSNHQMREWSHTPIQFDQPQSKYSKQDLIEQIQKYEEYLKKRSGSNLYIPNTTSLLKYGYQNNENLQKYKSSSLKQMRFGRQQQKNNLQDFHFTRTQSHLVSKKNYEAATALQENEPKRDFELYQNLQRLKLDQKRDELGKSQIKNVKNHSIIDKAKIRMSHIEGDSRKYEEEQTSNFSLYKIQANKQNLRKQRLKRNQEIIQEKTQRIDPKQIQKQTQNIQRQKKFQMNQLYYKFNLMKDQCDFLRQKFVQHIEKSHNIKI